MSNILTAGLRAFRRFVVDGVPSSGENEPDKLEVQDFIRVVDGELAAREQQLAGYNGRVDAVEDQIAELAAATGNPAALEAFQAAVADLAASRDAVIAAAAADSFGPTIPAPTPVLQSQSYGRTILSSRDGKPMAIQRPDGSVAWGPQPAADWHVEVRGSAGAREIWAWAPGRGEFRVSTAWEGADHSMPKLENLRLSWRADASVASVLMGGSLSGMTAAATRVLAVPVLGQSTSNGNVNGAVVTATAPRATRALMPHGGIRLLRNDQLESHRRETMPDDNVRDFVPALEQMHGSSGETGWAAAAWRMTEAGYLASTDAVVTATAGIGSLPYDDADGVRKGTAPYANLMRFIRRLRHVALLSGRAFDCPWVFHPWHEGSVALSQADTLADLLQAQSDYTTDIRKITGGTDQVLLVTDALASFRKYGQEPNLPYAVLQAAKANPTKVIYACPRYFLDHMADDVHLSAAGAALRGEYFGRAAVRTLNGLDALPVHMLTAVRTGAQIDVTFHVWSDAGALRFLTSRVSDPGNYGVEFLQTGGSAVTISSLTWVGPATLRIVLSGTPTGTGQKVRIACQSIADTGPTAGPRSCICDQAPGSSLYAQDLPNYAVPQEIGVTV